MTRARLAAVLLLLVLAAGLAWRLAPSGPPSPDDRRHTLGIDVSRHQGPIDWSLVAGDGVRFAWIKATEGGDWQDPAFAGHWDEAKRAGLRRGGYHFFTFCTPGDEQARNFIAHVPQDPDALPPAIDLEFAGNCSRTPSRAELRAELDPFVQALAAHYGQDPVLYVTPTSFLRFVAASNLDLPLWRRSLERAPRWPLSEPYRVWQYADDGQIAGIRGDVDLNVFAGSLAELGDWGR